MGDQAILAAFYAVFEIDEIPAAFVPQRIQRAVAEQAVEFLTRALVAGEALAFRVAEKFVFLHCISPSRG